MSWKFVFEEVSLTLLVVVPESEKIQFPILGKTVHVIQRNKQINFLPKELLL